MYAPVASLVGTFLTSPNFRFPNSIVPVELQVLINPHLSNLVGANLPPPAIRASSAPKRASDDEDGERTAKRAFTRRNAAVDLKYEEENVSAMQ